MTAFVFYYFQLHVFDSLYEPVLFHGMGVKRTHLATQQVHVAIRIIGFQQNSIVIFVPIMEF